jgi:hypothetical protein
VPSPNNLKQECLTVTPHGKIAFDSTQPNIARVYDCWLGGKNRFAADCAEAERLLSISPQLRECAQANRQCWRPGTRAATPPHDHRGGRIRAGFGLKP